MGAELPGSVQAMRANLTRFFLVSASQEGAAASSPSPTHPLSLSLAVSLIILKIKSKTKSAALTD